MSAHFFSSLVGPSKRPRRRSRRKSPRPSSRPTFDDVDSAHDLDASTLESLLQAARQTRALPMMFDGRVFHIDLLPAEWKNLFKTAGLKKGI